MSIGKDRPYVGLEDLSERLKISKRTISRWTSEANKLGGKASNGFPRPYRYLFKKPDRKPIWFASEINTWVYSLNKERNMNGEVIRELSLTNEKRLNFYFDIRRDTLLSIKDICEILSISERTFRCLRRATPYTGRTRPFPDPVCYFHNGLSPRWSSRKLDYWL